MPPRLNRYEIIEEIGSGGMSVVYRARDSQLSREVAVKVLHAFLAKQADAKKRFHREAVAVAKLHHRGILEIFDYSGPDAEDSYIVTELIDGVTLRDFVERINGLDHPELAALIVAEIGEALDHAHDKGVIHRDIKPENVMVTRDGRVKLMDFGIAQVRDGPRVTATGALLGSPAHMAPEVIDGHRPDARADVFSLGTILYWLATGRLPFDAPNPSALFKRILSGEYDDPQMVQPKIGNGLAKVIKKSLSTDREARYENAGLMVADLTSELEAVGLSPVAPEAQACLLDPDGFSRALEPKLIAILTAAGRAAMKSKQLGTAMDCLNQVLAIDPANREVKALMASVGKQRDLRLRGKQLAVAASIIALAGGGGFAVGEVYERLEPDPSARIDGAPTGLGGGVASADPTIAAARPSPPPAPTATAALTSTAGTAVASRGASKPPPKPGSPSGATGRPGHRAAPDRSKSGDRGRTATAAPPAVAPAAAVALTRADGVPPAIGKLTAQPPPAAAKFEASEPGAAAGGSTDRIGARRPADPDEALAPAAPKAIATATARLAIRIGNSFADIVIDGSRVRRDFYGGVIELPPGRHRLEVVKPGVGQYRPRILEVTKAGDIVEIQTDGSARALAGELLFPIPRPGAAAPPPGWVWAS